MQRNMSYDLDGAMALRDAGEVQRLVAPKTRVLRSPGLKPVFAPNESALRENTPDEELRDAAFNVDYDSELAADDPAAPGVVAVPGLGKVNLTHVGIGIAVGALLVVLLKK